MPCQIEFFMHKMKSLQLIQLKCAYKNAKLLVRKYKVAYKMQPLVHKMKSHIGKEQYRIHKKQNAHAKTVLASQKKQRPIQKNDSEAMVISLCEATVTPAPHISKAKSFYQSYYHCTNQQHILYFYCPYKQSHRTCKRI